MKWMRTNTDSRSEEHTSELQSRRDLVCRLLLEKKKEKATGSGTRMAPTPSSLLLSLFFFYRSGDHRDLHSFPTRRSSDLVEQRRAQVVRPLARRLHDARLDLVDVVVGQLARTRAHDEVDAHQHGLEIGRAHV